MAYYKRTGYLQTGNRSEAERCTWRKLQDSSLVLTRPARIDNTELQSWKDEIASKELEFAVFTHAYRIECCLSVHSSGLENKNLRILMHLSMPTPHHFAPVLFILVIRLKQLLTTRFT